MALDQVAAQAIGQAHRALEVDPVANAQATQAGYSQRLFDHVYLVRNFVQSNDGQAAPIHGDGVADLNIFADGFGLDLESRTRFDGSDAADRPELFDDASEHAMRLYGASTGATGQGAPVDRSFSRQFVWRSAG